MGWLTESSSPPIIHSGLPAVTVTPNQGPVGTRVHLSGDGFSGQVRQTIGGALDSRGYGVFLEGAFPPDCDLIATTGFTLTISTVGHLVAEFRAPAKGDCFQQARGMLLSPGWYKVNIGCHVCEVGIFRVTLASAAPS